MLNTTMIKLLIIVSNVYFQNSKRRAQTSVIEVPQVRLELTEEIPRALNDKVGDRFKG